MLQRLFDLHQVSLVRGLSQVRVHVVRHACSRSVALVLEKSFFLGD